MSPAEVNEAVRLHGLWLRDEEGGVQADLTDADLASAALADANLASADLVRADLVGADLEDADLTRANLVRADLRGAVLAGANLAGAVLAGAYLRGAVLAGAYLARADLTGADLARADLTGANLTGATMPDGRRWEVYRQDHLTGICSEPEVIARALAAWGEHDWSSCPMHSALGIDGLHGIKDDERRRLVACWVALYDGRHLTVDGAVRR